MGIGFWKGKIELKMDKYKFSPGEVITGELQLKLKKPTKAREVTIRLIGREKIRERKHNGNIETRTVKFFDLKIPLDGEKEYSDGAYPFEVPIPKDLFEEGARPDGFLGDVANMLEGLSGRRTSIRWELVGNIDIPIGFDLSKKQDIVIN